MCPSGHDNHVPIRRDVADLEQGFPRGCRGRLKPRRLQQNRPLGEPLREDAFLMFPQLRYTKGHEKVCVRRSLKGMMMIGQPEGLSASR